MKLMLSLWLLPPELIIKDLQVQIDRISVQTQGKCPKFLPHITILGGVQCSSEDEADAILKSLRMNFKGFGGIPCSFSRADTKADLHCPKNESSGGRIINNGPFFSAVDSNGKVIWNQSCVAVLNISKEFVEAVLLARQIFFGHSGETEEDLRFPPPLGKPHYSLAYGNDINICNSELKFPPDFISEEAVLYWTYPAKLDSVEQWFEVGRIDLN